MKRSLLFLLFSLTVFIGITACKIIDENDGTNVVSYETLTITPEGCSHTFDCGITIDVPEGALTEATEILVRKMEGSEIRKILEPLGRKADDILLGFEAKPDGLTFLKEVKITVQDIGLEPSDFVIVHELDSNNNTYTLADLAFSYDPVEDSIEFSLNHFSGYSAEVLEEMQKTECVDDPENCRCREVKVTQSDKNLTCDMGSCQQTESELTIEYQACGTTETVNYYELSEGCVPRINLQAGKNILEPGEQTTLSAELILGCEGLNGRSIDLSMSDPNIGSISPTSFITDSEGKAQSTFTAGETEGNVTVRANSTVSYNLSRIEANGEIYNGPERIDTASAQIDVKVSEGWSGVFEASFSGCNEGTCVHDYSVVVNFTIDEIDWDAGEWFGEATVTQSGDITLNSEECWVGNLYMPNTFTEVSYGAAFPETNEISFEFLGLLLLSYLDFDICCDDEGDIFCLSGYGDVYGFVEALDAEGNPVVPQFTVALEGDQVIDSGQCAMFGQLTLVWDNYTLNLER